MISSIMAPGQVHTIVTMSGPQHQLTQGAIVYGSQFLSARCMLSSLLSSWVNHISQSRALMELAWSKTITTCLVVMVSKEWKDIIRGHPQLHSATPEDVISLTCMALLFIGEYHKNRAH